MIDVRRRAVLPRLAALASAALIAACASPPPVARRSPAAVPPPANDVSVGLEEISVQAIGLVGVPYRWGGNTPEGGFDCSGLIDYVVRRATGVKLPRTIAEMGTRGQRVSPDALAPGDLVFFNTMGEAYSHAGIYVGQHRFVHAPRTGGTVRIEDMSKSYWAKRFTDARRLAGAELAYSPPK